MNWLTFLIPLGTAALVIGIGVWLSRIPEEESGALTDEEREKLAPLRFHKDVAMQLTRTEGISE